MSIRIGVAGLGQWGPNLLRNLRDNPRAHVAALCDRDAARLAQFSALHPQAQLVPSLEALLALDLRAVVLATPAGLHAAQARQCLEAGLDVFVEKPLALSAAEARALVQLARDRGRILMVGHTFLFNPAVRRAHELIREGALGRLQYILARRMSLGQIREDVNALWNLAPHDVSILRRWLGAMPTRAQAFGIPFFGGQTQEDVAFCHLEFPGPVLASIQVSWLAPVKVRDMLLVGSERMLRYDDTNADAPLVLYHRGARQETITAPDGSFERFRLQVRAGGEEIIPVPRTEPLAAEMAEFLECIETRREPDGSGNEAIDVTTILETLDRSLR